MQDHVVVADPVGGDAQLIAWSTRLLKAFCSEMPRAHFVSLWHLSDAPRGRVLTFGGLAQSAQCEPGHAAANGFVASSLMATRLPDNT